VQVGAGQQRVLPVLVMTLGFSRFLSAVMIPSRQGGDILANGALARGDLRLQVGHLILQLGVLLLEGVEPRGQRERLLLADAGRRSAGRSRHGLRIGRRRSAAKQSRQGCGVDSGSCDCGH